MKKLKIYNEVKGFRVPRAKLGQAFDKFVRAEKVGQKFEVRLVFVGETAIAKLNKKWRDVNESTDVLSFNYDEGEGEIYICVRVAEKNAREDGSGVNVARAVIEEVLFLFVHGLLHLSGHTHENKRKYDEMMKRARGILG
jgi:probable rRNA maturation factor